jgi:hypothetical protein
MKNFSNNSDLKTTISTCIVNTEIQEPKGLVGNGRIKHFFNNLNIKV